jgi:hypothetical protein
MRRLDPRIHRKKSASFKPMDCRVKPGNDGGWVSTERLVLLDLRRFGTDQ